MEAAAIRELAVRVYLFYYVYLCVTWVETTATVKTDSRRQGGSVLSFTPSGLLSCVERCTA